MPIGDGKNFVILGRQESGYSLKVRSAMRYKGFPHEWLDRCLGTEKLFQAHAKVQLIPLVFMPDGAAIQDSTPIIELLEEKEPEPSLHPGEPALRFLSILLEEYGDEWANKLMFQYRWGYAADQKARSRTLARGMMDGHPVRFLAPVLVPIAARLTVRRMVPRMAFAGANENNAPLLVASFRNLVKMLDRHLSSRPYIFGGRPAFGDFGVWGQLYQAFIDPTCGAHIRATAPSLCGWLDRMLDPKPDGPFETLDRLAETLMPIFSAEGGPRFLAWDAANARAWDLGEKRTELEMDGRTYYQKTFKYPAQNFSALRKAYAYLTDDASLVDFLEKAGCHGYLS